MSEQPSGPRRDWHDYLRSGWTIAGALVLIVGTSIQMGRLLERIDRPAVAVSIPEPLRAELDACRALTDIFLKAHRSPP